VAAIGASATEPWDRETQTPGSQQAGRSDGGIFGPGGGYQEYQGIWMADPIGRSADGWQSGVLLECFRAVAEQARDLKLKQLQMFLIVAEQEGLTLSELSAISGDSASNVSRFVRSMTSPGDPGALSPAFGLVELMANQADRRVRHVVLTEKGRRLYLRLIRIISG